MTGRAATDGVPTGGVPTGGVAIEVLAAGPLTTVQDAGRFGWRAVGVPAAGPADRASHAAANRMVGNPAGAAALECTLRGPRLRFTARARVAVVGAPASVDGVPLDAGAGEIPDGAVLTVGRAAPGIRAYLAVAGGIAVPPVLGSRSTDTLAGLGPPRLAAGMTLPVGEPAVDPVDRPLPVGDTAGAAAEVPVDLSGRPLRMIAGPAAEPGVEVADRPLRVIAGPHQDWFAAGALDQLCATPYTVTPAADRVGLRLAGPPLRRARTGELPVCGMVAGALQVPPDGQPILLLANHGPTGGYPVLAVVATVDLPLAGQARPGRELRFAPTTRAAAVSSLRGSGSGGGG